MSDLDDILTEGEKVHKTFHTFDLFYEDDLPHFIDLRNFKLQAHFLGLKPSKLLFSFSSLFHSVLGPFDYYNGFLIFQLSRTTGVIPKNSHIFYLIRIIIINEVYVLEVALQSY